MTATELQDLLVRTLVRIAVSTQRQWDIVGPVHLVNRVTQAHCNWTSIRRASRANCRGRAVLDQMRLDYSVVVAA